MKNRLRIISIVLALLLVLSSCQTDKKTENQTNKDAIKENDVTKDTSSKVEDGQKEEANTTGPVEDTSSKGDKKPEEDEKEQEIPEEVDPLKEGKLYDYMKPFAISEIGKYAAEKLDNGELVISLDQAKKDLNIQELSIEDLKQALGDAILQNPQFRIVRYNFNEKEGKSIEVEIKGFEKEEYIKSKEKIKKLVEELLDAKEFYGKSDEEKSLMIYDIVIKHLYYDNLAMDLDYGNVEIRDPKFKNLSEDEKNEYIASADDVLVGLEEGRAICSGYSNLYTLLARAVGLEAYNIMGISGGGAHSWNYVVLNNEFYTVDPTWGDTDEVYENPTNKYKFLNIPPSFSKKIREEQVLQVPMGLPDKQKGKSFEFTYFSQINLVTNRDEAKDYVLEKIEDLKKRNPNEPEDWLLYIPSYDLREKSAVPIVEEINNQLDANKENVAFYDYFFLYSNIKKVDELNEKIYKEQ